MELNKPLTLGSLFDGSGGFPLGGLLSGIVPVWASEIEPFPIRVTTKRLPFMKHYGDVSRMHGGEVEPVDIITFGSPCQDMSIAGKRAGLAGSRSNLFYEAIRIIKEMRCATDGKYPRYIVWENVPGAFSSSGGQDFRSVLEAVAGIKQDKDTEPAVPGPPKGKWTSAGSIVGDDHSIAWRVLDAQFWGVPQRRRRIFLVADLAGWSAEQILFESESLSGYSPKSFSPRQGTARSASAGIGMAGFYGRNRSIEDKTAIHYANHGLTAGQRGVVLNDQGGGRMDVSEDVACTLRAEAHHAPCVIGAAGFCTEHSDRSRSIGCEEERSPTLRSDVVPAAVTAFALENDPTDSRVRISENGVVQTLTSRMGTGGNNVPLLMKIRSGCEGGGKGPLIQRDKSAALSCGNDQTLFDPCAWDGSRIAPTLTANNAGGSQRMPDKDNFNCILEAYGICSKDSNPMKSLNPKSGFYKADTSRTLDGNSGNPTCGQGGVAVVESYSIQGSMIGREDKNGPGGTGVNSDVSFTLNATDRHAVYAMTTGSFSETSVDVSPTILARDYKGPTAVAFGVDRATMDQGGTARFAPTVSEELQPTIVAKGPGAVAKGSPEYTVRRLTPTECARLQGFPDRWCEGLETDDPSEEEIEFWTEVFETHRRITGLSSKPKTKAQIIKWLMSPHSDSAEYRMWGNGVALPCVAFVLSGIVWSAQMTAENRMDSSTENMS